MNDTPTMDFAAALVIGILMSVVAFILGYLTKGILG